MPPDGWESQVVRFHRALEAIDQRLAAPEPIEVPLDRWYQGPFADAPTHVGQIALLRRMAGSPVQGEAFFFADIQPGRVGPDQKAPDPKYVFE